MVAPFGGEDAQLHDTNAVVLQGGRPRATGHDNDIQTSVPKLKIYPLRLAREQIFASDVMTLGPLYVNNRGGCMANFN